MDLLSEILKTKEREVSLAKTAKPLDLVRHQAQVQDPARNMLESLRASPQAVIAECKQKSPSKGTFLNHYDPAALAQSYQRGGARAISVLTDKTYFGGDLSHLSAVDQVVDIPLMRKDFIIDSYQIYEARAAGADSFLLIAGTLDRKTLEEFILVGRSLGMEPLVESHSPGDLEDALATSALLIGVNNRSLRDFSVDLVVGEKAAPQILQSPAPGGLMRLAVCESGIKSREDIQRMQKIGYTAFLVGESLVTSSDPEATLRLLCH